MKLIPASLSAAAALLVAVSAQAADPKPATGKPAAPAAAKTPIAPVDEAKLPEIVAKVNGVDIKKADLQNAVETVKMQLEVVGQAVPSDRKDEMWRGLLDEIIASELLAQEATSRKVVVTEADVEGELTKFRERFPSEQIFQSALKEQGLTEAQIKTEVRKQLGIKKLLDTNVFSKVKVDEKSAKAYYEKNPEMFAEPEKIHAAHVLVKVEKGADDKAKAEARKEAELVLKEAKAGKDFAALAKEHSDDPGSKDSGGDLDFFPRGRMVPAFEEAAFKLAKPGELSDVVETPYGFHVIKLLEKQSAAPIKFADVKDDLIAFLTDKERADAARSYVEGLRKKAKVQIFI